MEIHCQSCGKAQSIPDSDFGDEDARVVKCAGCGTDIRVINPKMRTLRIDTTRKSVPTITSEYTPDGRLLTLPKDKVLSLKVLEGEDVGTVFALAKPRVTIGRSSADIVLDDQSASRLHCALEITEDWVLLRDLDSTNGTLVNNQPIQSTALASGDTFRVGKHVLQLLITPKES